jgi:hypothetical protein
LADKLTSASDRFCGGGGGGDGRATKNQAGRHWPVSVSRAQVMSQVGPGVDMGRRYYGSAVVATTVTETGEQKFFASPRCSCTNKRSNLVSDKEYQLYHHHLFGSASPLRAARAPAPRTPA